MSGQSSDPEKILDQLTGTTKQVEALARHFLSSLCESHDLINDHVKLLTSILDSVNDGLLVVDAQNKLMLTNRAAVRLAGIDPQVDWQTQVEEHYQCYDGRTGVRVKFGEGIVAAALKDGRPRESEVFVRSERLPPEGVWFRLSVAPVIGEDGTLRGAVTVFQDISQAKSALNKVKELYNAAPCGYHSLTENGIFAEINDTEIGWLGVSRDHLIRKAKFSSFLSRSSHPVFSKYFAALASAKPISNVELDIVGAGGETRKALWSSVPITDKQGRLLATRCTLFDITERYRLQRELDALAALIAHDIKNHLVATAGVLDLLSEDQECEIGTSAMQVVESLRVSNQDQLQALDNLINLWAAGQTISQEETKASVLITEAIALVADAARLRDVGITVRIDDDLPSVWVPQTAMRHVICNLLHNAIKFSEPSQTVQVSAHTEDSAVTIVISDSGPGMSRREIENLFRVRAETRPKGFSSGLGLYLCQQIVEAAGGSIRCESEQGKGTRFYLQLSVKRNPHNRNNN